MRWRAPGRLRARRGLTLLELMVVLAVVTIFTFLVLPKLRFTLAVYNVERTARQLAADLQLAQTEAWRRNRSVTVTRDGSGSWYAAQITTLNLALFRRGVDGGSTLGLWNDVRFRPLGPPVFGGTDTSLAVTIQNASAGVTLTRTVRVARGGAVSVGR